MRLTSALLTAIAICSSGCTNDDASADLKDVSTGDIPGDTTGDTVTDTLPAFPSFTVMTFNTGTSEQNGRLDPDDRYTEWHALQSDEYYGDGLAWTPAVDAAREFIAGTAPDIIAFQEIFHSDWCADIPGESRVGFVCETWQEGDPTVARTITGPDYQVMCNPGKPDKCSAVRKAFGRFEGCDGDFCLEGMSGCTVDTCGKGVRIGRATILLTDGHRLNLVSVHASSGFKEDEMQCRVWQFEQIFIDMCDAGPGAAGDYTVVMGDFNTDPGRATIFDPSAARLVEFVGPERDFHFITEVGEEVTPTYGGVGNIDHVVSNVFEGSCRAAGISEGFPAVIEDSYFDHTPIFCELSTPAAQ